MRYRWDPAYPMGRRDTQNYDAAMRASDDERNAVADKLSRHYAEGRLDEVEFKNRLDTAMSATTRGDLNGLFDDLPRLSSEPPPPPPRHRRVLPWILVVVVVAIAAGASIPFFPLYHVPWLLFAIVGFFVWRRAGGHRWAPPPPPHAPGPRGRAPQLGHGPLSRRRARPHPQSRRYPHCQPRPARPARPARIPRRTATRARCAPWSSSPASPAPRSRSSPLAAPSPPPTPGRWSRRRACPSGCGTSSRAGTPSCSATAPRSGCSGGVTRGRSTRSSTGSGRPSPSWRCRPSLCSLSANAPSSRSPNTIRSWPGAWWRGRPPRPTAWRSPCSMPCSSLADTECTGGRREGQYD